MFDTTCVSFAMQHIHRENPEAAEAGEEEGEEERRFRVESSRSTSTSPQARTPRPFYAASMNPYRYYATPGVHTDLATHASRAADDPDAGLFDIQRGAGEGPDRFLPGARHGSGAAVAAPTPAPLESQATRSACPRLPATRCATWLR
jgi:hypothetical protein